MIYRDFQDLKLSALGFGGMRLPVIDGKNDQVDQTAVNEMVDLALEKGINYFDTAWGYHDGNSELALGEALHRHDRDSFYLASKFPGYNLDNMGKVEEIFEKQLEKCQVDHFDFYLIHNVCELNIDAYLDPQYRTYEYLMEQKKAGRIRHLGFSCHGSLEVLRRFLEAYGEGMEFCQLQVNYVDYEFQQSKEKMDMVLAQNIPVWVMEPVRGGKLANLNEEETARLHALRPNESAVAWAFRFLQTLPVTMTLSGMSDLEQLKDNLATYETDAPLNEAEMEAILTVGREMVARTALPCTACRYCTTHCPMGLDIPTLLDIYNEHTFTGGGFLPTMRLGQVPEGKRPDACIGCRSCEAVCPQQIKISEIMADYPIKN